VGADSDPGQPASGPESVYRSLVAADARPAIRAASGPQLHAAMNDITTHLCDHVRRQASCTAAAPDQWPGAGEAGSLQAALELFDDIRRAVAASWLHALQFDPDRAAAEPHYHGTVIGPGPRYRPPAPPAQSLAEPRRPTSAPPPTMLTPAPPWPPPPRSPTTSGMPGPA
jgi:hypothetical protein